MRNLLLPSLVILGLFWIGWTQASSEKRLVSELLTDYTNPGSTRPVKDSSAAVEVKTGFTLIQILDVDLDTQVLDCIGWVTLTWKDEFLSWDPAGYEGLARINMNPDKIWIPDVLLFNAVGPTEQVYGRVPAAVFSDGTVMRVVGHRLRVSCAGEPGQKDLTCTLKYGSWTYHEGQLDLQLNQDRVDVDAFVPHHDWELLKTSVERHAKKYPCCEEMYVDVTYSLHLKARPKQDNEASSKQSGARGTVGGIGMVLMGCIMVQLGRGSW